MHKSMLSKRRSNVLKNSTIKISSSIILLMLVHLADKSECKSVFDDSEKLSELTNKESKDQSDIVDALARTVYLPSENKTSACPSATLGHNEYIILSNGDIRILHTNETYKKSTFVILDGNLCLLEKPEANVFKSTKSILHCKKWTYDPDEFQVLANGSVLLFQDEILEEGTYELRGKFLYMCAPDEPDSGQTSHFLSQATMIIIGKVGTVISVIALSFHLIVFCLVPTLRNLPGYNLASMSVAFLIAYCFVIIGQIPEVLGTPCVVSAVLVHYFFLSAFFWMNIMTFDVWRALRLATKKLVTVNSTVKVKKFVLYSLYGWGIPLIILSFSVSIDHLDGIPESYKPAYGDNDLCWINNNSAKLIFFVGPAFMLFVINGIFFVVSAYTIRSNTMKDTGDQQRMAKRNFTLYVRMGLIMGVTWLIGVVSVIVKREELWFVFDVLNSIQGLFIFLFFTCSRKVWTYFKTKYFLNEMGSSTFPTQNSVLKE